MALHPAFTRTIEGVPAIIYPSTGLEAVMERSHDAVTAHLQTLHMAYPVKGHHYIAVPWAEKGKVMADLFVFEKGDEWNSAWIVHSKTYRGLKRVSNIGIGCSDETTMLGAEEQLRRSLPDFEAYFRAERPRLPDFARVLEYFDVARTNTSS